MWASPMWSLIALIFISMIPESIFQNVKKGLAKGFVIWLCLITLFMMCYIQFGGKIRNKASRMDWPQQEISVKTQQKWNEISNCKIDNITGDNWLAILAATGLNHLPSVMISASAAYSPWMNLPRLEQNGTFALWEKGKKPILPYVSKLHKNNQITIHQGEWLIAWDKVPNKAPLVIEWQAFVPQKCTKLKPRDGL